MSEVFQNFQVIHSCLTKEKLVSDILTNGAVIHVQMTLCVFKFPYNRDVGV